MALLLAAPYTSPLRSLLLIYVSRTVILLALAIVSSLLFPDSSPSGYDTSTSHISNQLGSAASFSQIIAEALTRWDALYYVNTGKKGYYLWEQEWAFAPGIGIVVRAIEALFVSTGGSRFDIYKWSLVASLVSCGAHILSAVILYYIVLVIFNGGAPSSNKVQLLAFTTAALHILSPAGIFLIAPYSESLFSALSFIGYLLYCHAVSSDTRIGLYHIEIICAGICFGASCLMRSNGILNGTLFLIELFECVKELKRESKILNSISKCLSVGLAGLLTSTGLLWIQYNAWKEYCDNESPKRGWCLKPVPMIYTFVQRHYWNVGFLRYWTLSNVPLFLLALPILCILIFSAASILYAKTLKDVSLGFAHTTDVGTEETTRELRSLDLFKRLALPQIILGTLALTNYHVQIITRLSSGFVVWYIVVAAQILGEAKMQTSKVQTKLPNMDQSQWKWGNALIRWSVGYAVIQAVLFGGFLPPA